jgi:hypothetical protein
MGVAVAPRGRQQFSVVVVAKVLAAEAEVHRRPNPCSAELGGKVSSPRLEAPRHSPACTLLPVAERYRQAYLAYTERPCPYRQPA